MIISSFWLFSFQNGRSNAVRDALVCLRYRVSEVSVFLDASRFRLLLHVDGRPLRHSACSLYFSPRFEDDGCLGFVNEGQNG